MGNYRVRAALEPCTGHPRYTGRWRTRAAKKCTHDAASIAMQHMCSAGAALGVLGFRLRASSGPNCLLAQILEAGLEPAISSLGGRRLIH